jgi:hypothetical protein
MTAAQPFGTVHLSTRSTPALDHQGVLHRGVLHQGLTQLMLVSSYCRWRLIDPLLVSSAVDTRARLLLASPRDLSLPSKANPATNRSRAITPEGAKQLRILFLEARVRATPHGTDGMAGNPRLPWELPWNGRGGSTAENPRMHDCGEDGGRDNSGQHGALNALTC